jgi:hypothetical protein
MDGDYSVLPVNVIGMFPKNTRVAVNDWLGIEPG